MHFLIASFWNEMSFLFLDSLQLYVIKCDELYQTIVVLKNEQTVTSLFTKLEFFHYHCL